MMKRLDKSPGKLANDGRLTEALRKQKKMESLAVGPGGPRRDSKKREHGSPMVRRRKR